MRRFVFTLALAGSFIATAVYGLSAPSSLSAREKHAPAAQQRTVTVSEANRPSTTVVIDAGHGGFDRGGIRRQLVQEKTMNLDVAQRLKAVLVEIGRAHV